MRSGGTGDERVGRVDRAAAPFELGLVAPGPHRRLPRRLEEVKAAQQIGRGFPLLGTDASLDLGDIDAARPKRVATGQKVEQQAGRRIVAAEVGDQNGRVDQVEAQAGDSVRRVLRTQAAAARRSRQCG